MRKFKLEKYYPGYYIECTSEEFVYLENIVMLLNLDIEIINSWSPFFGLYILKGEFEEAVILVNTANNTPL